jgi:hypothetical protein
MRRSVVLAVVVVTSLLASCSGDSGDVDTTAPAATSETSPPTAQAGTDATAATNPPAIDPPATDPPPTEPPIVDGATGPIPPGQPATNPAFQYHAIADQLEGASGANPADFNGDGFVDLAVVSFGQRPVQVADVEPGTLSVWYQNGDPTTWEQQALFTEDDGFYFINEPYVGDLDGDDDIDILVGIGFFVCANIGSIGPCGALVEFENVGRNGLVTEWERNDIIPNGYEQFFHKPAVGDLNGDGFVDIVAMGETFDTAETVWFAGSADGFAAEPTVLGPGGGSYPTIADIDGDGDLDIASGQYFQTPASAIWWQNDGNLNFTQHTITEEVGKTIQLSLVEGFDGPGTAVWLVSNHTNTTRPDQKESGLYRLTPGPDPTQPWAVDLLTEGIQARETVGTAFQAAPGVFGWGDVDGDGDIDITLSGDGDPRVFIVEQVAVGDYNTVVLEQDFGQAGSMKVVDLNADGVNEILVSGYEAYQLRLYSAAA